MNIAQHQKKSDQKHLHADSTSLNSAVHSPYTRHVRQHKKRWLFRFIITLIFIGALSSVYVFYKAYTASLAMTKPMHTETITLHSPPIDASQPNADSSKEKVVRNTFSAVGSLINSRKKLRGEIDGTINILLLGKGTLGHPGKDLTDTIMIARIDTTRGKIALLSLPRDLYVKIPQSKNATKINALYTHGLDTGKGIGLIIDSVESITNLSMHYFLVANFDAFTSVVDALGGINITNERDILDDRYPGKNYSYETFTLEKGFHKLDGATALKYVRSRHGDPEGDFGRAKRQQQVLQAMKNKAFSIGTMSNPIALGKIFDALGDNIRTDVSFADISSFVVLTKMLDTQNINTTVIDAWQPNSLLRALNIGRMFALVPRAGRFDYKEIHTQSKNIFDQTSRQRMQREIARENPRITIISDGATHATSIVVRDNILRVLGDNVTIKIAQNSNTNLSTQSIHARLIDHTNTTKPFTLSELSVLLGTSVVRATAETGNDISIVLTADADTYFAQSTISKEQYDAAQSSFETDRVIIREE